MKRKFLNILVIFFIVFISMFTSKKVEAVDKCTWYVYDPRVYYDSSSNKYKPIAYGADYPIEYKLTYDSSRKKKFKLTVSNENFNDDNFAKKLSGYESCPEYIGIKYKRKWNNAYVLIDATQSDYKSYLNNVYKKNVTLYNASFSGGNYDVLMYDYYLDDETHMEANDKYDKPATPMYFTSKSTENPHQIRLEQYPSEKRDEFLKELSNLSGLKDKNADVKEHHKEDFYIATYPTWSNAIDYTINNLKTNCSGYKNSSSPNRSEYLDFLDKDYFKEMVTSNSIPAYNDSPYKNQIPSEKCYKSIVEARFMQASFDEWFSVTDWLSLTKVDQSKDNITLDLFYKFYEFAHLYSDGGQKVKNVYESLVAMRSGNDGLDNEDRLKEDPCSALCHDYNPTYNKKVTNSTPYEQCLVGENVKTCRTADKSCKDKCKPVPSSSYESCYDGCMKGKIGDENYEKMKEVIQNESDQNKKNIEDSIDKMIDKLSRVGSPTLDIDFNKRTALSCDDVSFFHGFYVVIRILAPIAVVLFGTLDYAKAVLSADIDKLNKSKKSLPKRILLLILFLGVPFIVSFMVNLFGGDFNLMKCIINGE